jgi:flagellar hook-length control protein FliK
MNLTFTDISSAFANMVQQNIPKEVMPDIDTTGGQKLQFAEKLNKILEKIEGSETNNNSLAKLDSGKNNSEKVVAFLSEELNKEKGTGFVAALQNIFLMLSNQDLKNASINADGLEELKKMLLKAGFKESDINDLIAELSENQDNKNIPLNELLNKLFELSFENQPFKEDESENYLEISAVPFLESLMKSLNIPEERIQEILTKADSGEKGLDLDSIIANLQDLQKESFYTGKQYKTRDNDENFSLLLKQMGLEQNKSDASSLTLADLVDSLEKLRAEISQHKPATALTNSDDQKNLASEKSLDILEALFKGLKLQNRENKSKGFEFSERQIKNQFKDQLFVPDKGESNTSELFMSNKEKTNVSNLFVLGKTSKSKSDATIKYGLKEVESMLSGKQKGIIDGKVEIMENKEFFRQFKSKVAKISDQNQISALDTKTNDTQSNLNLLKTKSSFKNLPGYVTQQVSKGLVRAINQGENTLRIQLKPPELGRLIITIDNTGSNIKVNIMTENSAAREMLTSNVNELRTVLSSSGVNLERFDVDMNSNFRQSMADAKNQSGFFSKRNQNREKFLSDSINSDNMNESVNLAEFLKNDGSLHFVA